MPGRRSQPKIPIETRWWFALFFWITGFAQFTVAPGVYVFEFADGTVLDEFAYPIKVCSRVALGTALRCQLMFVCEVFCAYRARFVHGGCGAFAAPASWQALLRARPPA